MYDYVESLYVGKSDRYFDGILGRGIAKTIMTGGESAVILGFMDNGTGKHQSNTVYSADGLSPAITTIEGGGTQQIKILVENDMNAELKCMGQMDNSDGTLESSNRVYNTNGIAPTLTTCGGGNLEPKILEQRENSLKIKNATKGDNREPLIVSSRGRNPNNPSDRSTNNFEQRLEVQQDGISNTLTTFQKDNYVLEQNPISTKGKKLDVAKTILSGYERTNMTGFNDDNAVFTNYQIRKLTPKECFRLMGVKDEDYDKLTVSNSQKYKQAGNSIVVDVLMAIFENMFINDCKKSGLF